MSKCMETARKELKEKWAEHGLSKDFAQELLQLIEDVGLDDKDGVLVRVVTLKRTKKAAKKDQDKDQKAEPQKEQEGEEQDGPSKEDLEQLCEEQSKQLVRLFLINGKLSEENKELHKRLAKLEQK